MKYMKIGKIRKDNKYPVRIAYKGEPNAFGGFYPGKVFNSLLTAEKLRDYQIYSGDTIENNSGQKIAFKNVSIDKNNLIKTEV